MYAIELPKELLRRLARLREQAHNRLPTKFARPGKRTGGKRSWGRRWIADSEIGAGSTCGRKRWLHE